RRAPGPRPLQLAPASRTPATPSTPTPTYLAPPNAPGPAAASQGGPPRPPGIDASLEARTKLSRELCRPLPRRPPNPQRPIFLLTQEPTHPPTPQTSRSEPPWPLKGQFGYFPFGAAAPDYSSIQT